MVVWRFDVEDPPFPHDYSEKGLNELMELSVFSLKASIPLDIKDINAVFIYTVSDLGLHASYVKAVECEFTLLTVGVTTCSRLRNL
jgi:hypothetical protein